MTTGTTPYTVDITVSIPREFWFGVGEEHLDFDKLRAEFGGKNRCAGNGEWSEEWLVKEAIIPFLAKEAGMNPDNGELHITKDSHVELRRSRDDSGQFTDK